MDISVGNWMRCVRAHPIQGYPIGEVPVGHLVRVISTSKSTSGEPLFAGEFSGRRYWFRAVNFRRA